MRVGIFDPYLDDVGGGEKYMMTIASVLSDKYDVDVFWDKLHDLKLVGERFGIDTNKFNIVPNIFKPEVSLIRRFLETQKYYAIIFLSDGSIPLVGSKKLFIHIQQPLANLQRNFLGKLKLNRVTKFFYNSQYTQKFLSEKFHLNPEVIYPPVALHPKRIKKENIILHVGRFRTKNVVNDDYKKQGVMLKTFKAMVDSGLNNWKLVFAVSFPDDAKKDFEKMRQQAREYPIEFLINQNNEKLWDIYSKAKIYWHASGYGENLIKHPEYAEHFGISTVEAMGAGAVPVVINAGGQKEIVDEGVTGYLWNTLEELQEKSLYLIRNADVLQKLSKNAEKKAKDYSPERFAERIFTLLS